VHRSARAPPAPAGDAIGIASTAPALRPGERTQGVDYAEFRPCQAEGRTGPGRQGFAASGAKGFAGSSGPGVSADGVAAGAGVGLVAADLGGGTDLPSFSR